MLGNYFGRKIVSLILPVVVFVGSGGCAGAQAPNSSPNGIIVKFKAKPNAADRQALQRSVGGAELKDLPGGFALVKPSDPASVKGLLEKLKSNSNLDRSEAIDGDPLQLLAPSPANMDLPPAAEKKIADLKRLGHSDQIKIMVFRQPQVRGELLLSADVNADVQFKIPVEEGKAVSLSRVKSAEPVSKADSSVWKGKGVDSEATLVVKGDSIVGTIDTQTGSYRVNPLGGGLHAVTKINPASYPGDEPPSFSAKEKKVNSLDAPAPVRADFALAREDGAISTLVLLVAYTSDVDTLTGGGDAFAKSAVSRSNDMLQKSGIKAEFVLGGTWKVDDYMDSGSVDADEAAFEGKNDGKMDKVHRERDEKKADICVLLTTSKDYCGMAADILVDEGRAFCTVNWDCAIGNKSFPHEIGHLLGARHDEAADPTPGEAHGYIGEDMNHVKFRTIMAYDSGCGCERKDFFSNPDKMYKGVPTGNAKANNVKVINAAAPAASRFRN